MTVLITGATGLIGTQLTADLHQAGYIVHFLTTRSAALKQEDNHKGFLWNPDKKEIDPECIEGVDAIVHLVGAPISEPWTKAYRQEILDSRIQTMRLLEDTLKNNPHKVQHFISASGISIYPNSLTANYKESDTAVANNFLGEVVVKWEAAADRFEALGIKVAKLRTGVVLDSDQGALPQIIKPVKLGVGAALGSGDQWFSWIHLQDISGIYLHLIQNALTGVYNGVAPTPVSNKELTYKVAQTLGKKIILPAVPGFVLKIAMGERANLVLEGQQVSSEKIEKSGYTFAYSDIATALSNLL